MCRAGAVLRVAAGHGGAGEDAGRDCPKGHGSVHVQRCPGEGERAAPEGTGARPHPRASEHPTQARGGECRQPQGESNLFNRNWLEDCIYLRAPKIMLANSHAALDGKVIAISSPGIWGVESTLAVVGTGGP
eukprot:242057-Prorocentrum_minimum.AAC.2